MPKSTIESVKNYWDSRPCNVKRSDAPLDSLRFMRETEFRKFLSEPHIPGFAEYGKWAGKRVLEIGCGIGIDTVNFARAGAKVTGVDLSKESLQVARKRAEHAKVTIDFRLMNAENLEWAAAFNPRYAAYLGFDLIYAFGSIHHSPDPKQIIIGARKQIKNGGTLKIMVYNKYSWKSLWILLKYGKCKFWKFSELIARYSEAQTGCPITHVYSRRSIKGLVESAGFRVTNISVDHIFPWDIEEYKKYRYTLAFPWKWLPKAVHRWLEKRIGWHILLEARA